MRVFGNLPDSVLTRRNKNDYNAGLNRAMRNYLKFNLKNNYEF